MTLHVVTGPPGAGKTTYVDQNARPGDIRIDLDRIANLITGLAADNHEHTGSVLAVAQAMRKAAVARVLADHRSQVVWLVHTKPNEQALAEYERAGATIHEIDPGREVVMQRCAQLRNKNAIAAATEWYQSRDADLVILTDRRGSSSVLGLHTVDASELPDPVDVRGLAKLTGRNPKVAKWVMGWPVARELVEREVRTIQQLGVGQIAVVCPTGRQRSVAVAEEIAAKLRSTGVEVVVRHRRITNTKSRHERGLGDDHYKQRAALLRGLVDGEPCWWCAEPMFREAARNPDGKPLAADHTISRAAGGRQADRLLHFSCNSQRQEGARDSERPAARGLASFQEVSVDFG